MACEYNTDWNSVPNTHPNTKPLSYRQVENVPALLIQEGFLRGSTFNDCYFEVANSPRSFDTFDVKKRIEVEVLWFRKKPATTWAHITLNEKFEFICNFSGEVDANIIQ
jgi:hypothetical protein